MSSRIETAAQEGVPFRVGEWLVEPALNRLSRGGVSIQLELKAMDVLLCLVERAGELVSKDTLFDTVWRTEFVSDNTIFGRIAELRDAFGDDAQQPRYIETIRKRGYRLIAEVRPVSGPEERPASIPDEPPAEDDARNPYPGLAAFTEADADRFFGRDTEAARLWRTITSRRLMAVIGPSGVGKSSLLRAGVAARAPPGWRVVVFSPGENPVLSLARSLASDHSGDPSAMARLLGFNDSDTALAVVSRWRGRFEEAVLVVDQFEELFTLNPPAVQGAFIELLGRLVDAADVRLVLAMRDDYLYRCQEFTAIAPIFKDLTPLPPPTPEGLRRALIEPAARRLHRFENELLVDRMVAEVAGERGALPLMAFAVHQLWEERDREQRLLTEEAYERIGGVAGALAQHADATLERIGPERLPIVRELFRNLVTAEGTRAVRDVDELLSVFAESERESAEEVLRELVDARLLTSYKHDDEDGSLRRVEIVHESLLSRWPRLVRWQTQDADSARLRDELRQAARTWDEHERSDDYLWTGQAYREYSVWRDNYPGGLTDLEEEFADASTTHARRRAVRRRMVTSGILIVAAVVAVVFGALWRKSVLENRRAEAQRLVALGQLRLEDYPTATLAHAIASLELADSDEARRLALQALWKGPTAFKVSPISTWDAVFSGDDRWLVQAVTNSGDGSRRLGLFGSQGSEETFDALPGATGVKLAMAQDTRHFMSWGSDDDAVLKHILWSIPDRRRVVEAHYQLPARTLAVADDVNRNRFVVVVHEVDRVVVDGLEFAGSVRRLSTLRLAASSPGDWTGRAALGGADGLRLAFVDGNELRVYEVGTEGLSHSRSLGAVDGPTADLAVDPLGRFVATATPDGTVRLWSLTGSSPAAVLRAPPGVRRLNVTPDGSLLEAIVRNDDTSALLVWDLEANPPVVVHDVNLGSGMSRGWEWDASGQLVAGWGPDWKIYVRSTMGPAEAEPLILSRADILQVNRVCFSPRGRWLASADLEALSVWPLRGRFPSVFRLHDGEVRGLLFSPNGEWLASSSSDGTIQTLQLDGGAAHRWHIVMQSESGFAGLAVSPDGTLMLAGDTRGDVHLVGVDGGDRILPDGFAGTAEGVAFSPDGRLAAAVGGRFNPADRVIRIWDVASGRLEKVLNVGQAVKAGNLQFTPDGYLLSSTDSGPFRWDVDSGRHIRVHHERGVVNVFSADERGKKLLAAAYVIGPGFTAYLIDLESFEERRLTAFGDEVRSVAIDRTGSFGVIGTRDGEVMVGNLNGEQPHLLLGHEMAVGRVAIDPRGRWIASASQDGLRLWPMPDLSKPPLHTLPHDELVAKLKSLTNLRVVRDEADPTGWTLTHDPFPGWGTVPTW